LYKQLLFLAVLMFIPPLSFAQLADHTFDTSIEEGQVYIIVQIQIRDSNQNLVGYIETDRTTVQNLDKLLLILDAVSTNSENTKIITIDEKKYHVITEEHIANYLSNTLLSMHHITSNDDESLVYVNYDSLQVNAGNVVITTWTMVRPA
jgi:hypothetical protein